MSESFTQAVLFDVHEYGDGSVRNRRLSEWGVCLLLNDSGLYDLCLTGVVVNGDENERPKAAGAIRYTRTSPIEKIDGRTVLTKSGSVYELVGGPGADFLNKIEKGQGLDTEEDFALLALFSQMFGGLL